MTAGAIDIGGTKIAVGLVGADGTILEHRACPSEPEKGFADGMARVEAMLRDCLRARPGERLEGIGIGCTGPVDPTSGLLGPNNFLVSWEGFSPAAALSERFGVAAATENDADAAALAETRWGAGRGALTCLYITVSTGIGGGLVAGGRLYRGVRGAHPEIGHHIIDPQAASAPCFCGARGCWESLASGPALALWYNQRREAGPGAVTAREVCLLAQQGDSLARQAVEREARYLGIGLANMVTLFTPDVIALGGGVMESWSLFESMVVETIRTSCGLVPHEQVSIRRASLGAKTGLAGAGAVWFHRAQPA